MENYSVIMVTIKELLLSGQYWKIGLTLVALVAMWRLPDLIKAVRWW